VKEGDSQLIRVYDTRTGKLVGETVLYNPNDTYIGTRYAAFAPDGETVALYDNDAGVTLYSATGGIRAKTGIFPEDLDWIEYSRDGKAVIGHTTTGEVIRWDAATLNLLGRTKPALPFPDGISNWERSTDGRTIAVLYPDGPLRVLTQGEAKP